MPKASGKRDSISDKDLLEFLPEDLKGHYKIDIRTGLLVIA